MKTLKITLTLVAIALLTVSGVQSEQVMTETSDKDQPTKIDLLAHGKKKLSKLPSNSSSFIFFKHINEPIAHIVMGFYCVYISR